MNLLSSKTSKWIIIAPIAIVSIVAAFIYFYMNFVQENRIQALINTAQTSHKARVLTLAQRKINEVIFALNEAREFDAHLENDEWLLENLRYSLVPTGDYAYIFRLNKTSKKLTTLFSNDPKVIPGEEFTKHKRLMIDTPTLNKLSKGEDVYQSKELSQADFINNLFMPYQDTNLIMGVGIISEPFEMRYFEHFKQYSDAIDRQRDLIFTLVLLFFGLISALITLYVKKLNDNFENSKKELNGKNKALSEQLYKDPISGLHNEKMLHKRIKESTMSKLILIEVDNFKAINEYSGHEATEEIVKFMKTELLKFCEKFNEFNMELFRISNNQFALLENAPLDMERYEEIASQLAKSLKDVTIISPEDNQIVDFSCTIGFSMEDVNIFETASIALRRAKADERNFLCYFKNLGEGEEYKSQAKSADSIKKALEQDNVIPFFQPIFDKDQNITKHECLVRIIGENKEILAPRIFLDVSRKIKRYSDIEKSLIQKSLQSIQGTDKVISINLSSRDMTDSNVSNFVIEKITAYNLAKQVIFEILEDENIQAIDRVAGFIKKVKAMGVRIAIDDFGSGYSNFSYLLELKPDFLKIDGSLIKNINQDSRSYAIVNAILTFAKQLNIKTIAEFVHSKEVLKTCIDLGIDEFQGFYLGEPSPKLL